MSTVARTPPERVRHQLRREVGYGCPVSGCGVPYLYYHHFDPPFHIEHHHRPEDMVALCAAHHDEADKGTWTPAQLRLIKEQPFLLEEAGAYPTGHVRWKREHLLLKAGGNLFWRPDYLLRANELELISVTTDDEGSGLLNIQLYDLAGEPIIEMVESDWTAVGPLDDLVCPPKTASLRLKSGTVSLDLRMHEASTDDIVEFKPPDWVHQGVKDRHQEFLDRIAGGNVLLCELGATGDWPCKYALTPTGTTLGGGMVVQGSVFYGGNGFDITCGANTGFAIG